MVPSGFSRVSGGKSVADTFRVNRGNRGGNILIKFCVLVSSNLQNYTVITPFFACNSIPSLHRIFTVVFYFVFLLFQYV